MCTQIRLWPGARLTHPGVHHLVKKILSSLNLPWSTAASVTPSAVSVNISVLNLSSWTKCGQQDSRWYPHHTYIFNSVLIFCSFCFPIKLPSEMVDGDDSSGRDQTWRWSIDRHGTDTGLRSHLSWRPGCYDGNPAVGAVTREKLDSRY